MRVAGYTVAVGFGFGSHMPVAEALVAAGCFVQRKDCTAAVEAAEIVVGSVVIEPVVVVVAGRLDQTQKLSYIAAAVIAVGTAGRRLKKERGFAMIAPTNSNTSMTGYMDCFGN